MKHSRPIHAPQPGVVRKPTIRDVAILAGVAIGSVSAVLNNNGRISLSTRERVRAAMLTLGYQPDLYASNLARKTSRMLGLVVSNLQNAFFAETAQAVEEEADRHGFQISLMTSNFSVERQRAAVERLLRARVSGIAVITSEYDALAREMVCASGVPSVYLDAESHIGNSTSICIDTRGGMQRAVEHLIALGHRDFLYIRNSQDSHDMPVSLLRSHRLRDEGFADAVRSCQPLHLNVYTIDTFGLGGEAGERAIGEALSKWRFTAIVAVTDTVAMGAYSGLRKHGLRIPEDVSVIGFDDAYFCRFLNPPLTTVRIPRQELSRLSVEVLVQLNGLMTTAQSLTIETLLIVRNSTAPPPDHEPRA